MTGSSAAGAASGVAVRRAAAAEHAVRTGLGELSVMREASGTSLFRSGTSVLRVADTGRSPVQGGALVGLARLLLHHGVSVVEPAGDATAVPGVGHLTVWGYVAPGGEERWEEVGRMLRRLHDVPLGEAAEAVGRRPPHLREALRRGRGRIERLAAAGVEVGWMSDLFEESYRTYLASDMQDDVLLHGDMNPSNVLHGEEGVTLCDLEACAAGAWVWDMVKIHVASVVSGSDGRRLEEMSAGYGSDPTAHPSWAALCWVQAVNGATHSMLEEMQGSTAGGDVGVRVEWLRDGAPGLPPLRGADDGHGTRLKPWKD